MSAIWFAALTGDELLQARRAQGELAIANLPRVESGALPESGPFTVSFKFEPQRELVLVNGTVSGNIRVRCERCLESMRVAVDSDVRVALANGNSTDEPPDGYEIITMTDGQIRLVDLVEDEVLLAVPLVARHVDGQCGTLAGLLEQLRASATDETKSSPFAGLDELMRNKRN